MVCAADSAGQRGSLEQLASRRARVVAAAGPRQGLRALRVARVSCFATAALIAIAALVAGCGARSPQTVGQPPLRVWISTPYELRACRFASRQHGLFVELGEGAAKRTRSAVGNVWVPAESESSADMIAVPRIAAAGLHEMGLDRVEVYLSYGVQLRSPEGEQIADITASGTGEVDHPVLVDAARVLFHIGTLLIFERTERQRQVEAAFDKAGKEAAAQLEAALAVSARVRAHRNKLRVVESPTSQDAQLERLIDAVIAERSLAIAVLDLEPLSGEPTIIESYLGEELRTRLGRRPGVRTFERALLNRALDELRVNMSDLVDPEYAKRFGRMVSAQAIMTGTTIALGDQLKVNLRLLNTETGRVIGAGSALLATTHGFPATSAASEQFQALPGCPFSR